MKKTIRVLCVALLAMMVLSLVACSNFPAIKRNFEKAGYTYVDLSSGEDGAKQAATITADLEKGNISCTAHLFKTEGALLPVPVYALVLEFNSDKDMQKALSDSETLKGFVKDAQDSRYINGTCLLVPLSLTKADDMIKVFNGDK